MIFRTEQNQDGRWQWHLRSTKLQSDIACCAVPVATEKECLEHIDLIRLGVAAAIVRTADTQPEPPSLSWRTPVATSSDVAVTMQKFWRNYNLSIVLALLFLIAWAGQTYAGWVVFSAEQAAHNQKPLW